MVFWEMRTILLKELNISMVQRQFRSTAACRDFQMLLQSRSVTKNRNKLKHNPVHLQPNLKQNPVVDVQGFCFCSL